MNPELYPDEEAALALGFPLSSFSRAGRVPSGRVGPTAGHRVRTPCTSAVLRKEHIGFRSSRGFFHGGGRTAGSRRSESGPISAYAELEPDPSSVNSNPNGEADDLARATAGATVGSLR